MTAFVAVAYEDYIELLTDGATVRDDGTIAILDCKARAIGNLPMAFAGRGNYGALMAIYAALLKVSVCGGVDGTIEAFAKELGGGLPQLRGSQMDGIICAVSETVGPILLYFTTSDAVDGAEPFALHEVTPMHGAGSEPPAEALSDIGLPDRMATESLSEFGVDLFTVMRRHKMRHLNAGGNEVYGIGGHIDLTTITAAGCTTTWLHTWPEDVVGKTINPTA